MSETIGLIEFDPPNKKSTTKLTERLPEQFPDYQITALTRLDAPKMAFDSTRNQYHSTRILAILEENVESSGVSRVLGITSFDLYVPGMNFVFGEARCPGRAGVISTYRLKTSDARGGRYEDRIVKEAVHEIGHMFGLRHCTKSSCVMYFSETIADTDRKREAFCSECDGKMKWLLVD